MSGKLVGEVMDAAPALKSRGLSRTGFVALLAIAEKCHHETREGSVRWDHIRQVLYGVTKRTAQRAVTELRTLTLVELVSAGYGNRYGGRAPVYRIPPVLDDDTAMSLSETSRRDTAMSLSRFLDDDNSLLDDDISRSRRDIADSPTCQDVSLDGFYMTGFIDGGHARAREPSPSEPPRYCTAHPKGTTQKCGPCGSAREAHAAWEAECRRIDAEHRRRAIDNCGLCDEAAWLLGDDGSVDDRNIRCDHKAATR